MSDDKPRLNMPDLPRHKTICEVCGREFSFYGKRRPHTCNDGECRHAYHYNIRPDTWANHQFDLFG